MKDNSSNNSYSNLRETLKSFSKDEIKNLILIVISYFSVLFVYPIIRTTSKTYFLKFYDGFETPKVVLYAAITNLLIVFLMNKYQKFFNVKKIFTAISFLSMFVFLGCLYMIKQESKIFCYFFYIWKESYIVILLHLVLGYFNANVHESKAKLIYGPLGAIGSFGGVLGAELLKQNTNTLGIDGLVVTGSILLLVAVISFNLCKDSESESTVKTQDDESQIQKVSPLESVKSIWIYVALIMLMVGLTQFLVVISETQLDILLKEKFVDLKKLNIHYGGIYQKINIGSSIFGIFIVPFVLTRFKIKTVHFGILAFYSLLIISGLGLGANSIFLVSFAFIGIKATDYSLFNAAKELLYFPLNKSQKYGAKYLVDMIFYRFSKGIVALILVLFLSDLKDKSGEYLGLLTVLNYSTLILWFFTIFFLFNMKTKYFDNSQNV